MGLPEAKGSAKRLNLLSLPDLPSPERTRREWQLLEVLVLEEKLREKRALLALALEGGHCIEAGGHRAWLQDRKLFIIRTES